MVFVDISNTKKKQLETFFDCHEVYLNYFEVIGNKCGWREDASGYGEIFYYIVGKLNGNKLYNKITNQTITIPD